MMEQEPKHPAEPEILDLEHLREVCDGDLAFEREIVGDFLAQVTPLHESLAAALAVGDAAAIRFAAHSLKGSSRSLGAVALGEACAALEEIGNREDLARAPAALQRTTVEIGRLRQRIQQHLSGLAA